MRNHYIQILGHIMLCKDCSIEHKIGCSDSILKMDIFNLFVKGSPEFADMATNEYAATEGRASY